MRRRGRRRARAGAARGRLGDVEPGVGERLVPVEVGVRDVRAALGLGEEGGVLAVRVAVLGGHRCDVRVQLGRVRGLRAARCEGHRVVERALDRRACGGGLVPCVHADVFADLGVGLEVVVGGVINTGTTQSNSRSLRPGCRHGSGTAAYELSPKARRFLLRLN